MNFFFEKSYILQKQKVIFPISGITALPYLNKQKWINSGINNGYDITTKPKINNIFIFFPSHATTYTWELLCLEKKKSKIGC